MLKVAELLEEQIAELDSEEDKDSVMAAGALDFAAYDSADLARVASLLTRFANAFDRDGSSNGADYLEKVW